MTASIRCLPIPIGHLRVPPRCITRRPNHCTDLTPNDTPSAFDLRPTAARIESTPMQGTTIHTLCKGFSAHWQPAPAFRINRATLLRIAEYSPPHSVRGKLAALKGIGYAARVGDLSVRNCLGVVRSKYSMKTAHSIVRETHPKVGSMPQYRLSIRCPEFQRQCGVSNRHGGSR
jgi:hypothetical protein